MTASKRRFYGRSILLFFGFFAITSLDSCLATDETTANNNRTTNNSCDRASLDVCLEAIGFLLESPAMMAHKGIPHTEEAVQARCETFKAGMACVDDFKDRCLSGRRKQNMERGVAGARNVFTFLCHDPTFQSDFFKHQSCLRGTSLDWEYCVNHFQSVVAEVAATVNISRAERNLGFCCAKHGFLRCVYYSAQYMCRKEGAMFLMKMAQTLTEDQVHEDACRKIKFDQMCTAGVDVVSATLPPVLSGLLLLLVSSVLPGTRA